MNLDELRSAQAKERRKDSLQHLRDAFYDDVAAYVADLRAARDRRAEQVANPFSDDDVRRMSDEIETAEEVAEALYERRVGKVVKLASFAAADMSVETEGLTTQERALFDDLVARIRENKSTVLAALAGQEPPTSPDGSPTASAADGPDEEATGADAPATRDDATGPRAADEPPVDASPADGQSDPDVLAGAMGGESPASPSRESSEPDAGDDPAGPTDSEENADRTPTDRPASATADGGATPVEPGPAPPGAGDAGDAPPADGASVDDSSVDDSSADASTSPPTDAPAESDAAADRSAVSEADRPDGAADVDRETVRITRDVGSIFGVDEREYDLASEDVVTLPAENAEPLVRRDAAERIE
jgi:DNA replication factor GINS